MKVARLCISGSNDAARTAVAQLLHRNLKTPVHFRQISTKRISELSASHTIIIGLMPGDDTTPWLRMLRKTRKYSCFVVASDLSRKAVSEMLHAGVQDVFTFNDEGIARLEFRLQQTMQHHGALEEKTLVVDSHKHPKLIGQSTALHTALKEVSKLIGTRAPVCILGEKGTGKVSVANLLNSNNGFVNDPFIRVNLESCSERWMKQTLLTSKKMVQDGQIGLLQQSYGGMLVLESPGHASSEVMNLILEHYYAVHDTSVAFQLVFACHDAEAADRFFGLKSHAKIANELAVIELPTLRDRGADVLHIAQHLLGSQWQLARCAKEKLIGYSFPGNVTELMQVMELAKVLGKKPRLKGADLTFHRCGRDLIELPEAQTSLKSYNHKLIRMYLDKYEQNVYEVARQLKVGKSTIYRMLQEEKIAELSD